MTRFLTRKRDGQAFPVNKKVPRNSGNPSFVGVDKSQIEPQSVGVEKNNPRNSKLTSAQKQKAIKEFEDMRDMAELRALSKHSLEKPLTDAQYKRMMALKKKVLENSKPTSDDYGIKVTKFRGTRYISPKLVKWQVRDMNGRWQRFKYKVDAERFAKRERDMIRRQDTDNDGVPDSKDCEPYNPKKQDFSKADKMPKSKYVIKEASKLHDGYKYSN